MSSPLLKPGNAGDKLIVSMLKRRAVDEKVGVRKAAIQASWKGGGGGGGEWLVYMTVDFV